MIEVKGLCKSYGDRKAIDQLDFTIKEGSLVGFLGPNGAGKTTTMKILSGFMAPTSGTALVGHQDVFENPMAVKRNVGYLPEHPPVYGDMIVQDYLEFVAGLRGVPKNQVRHQALKVIEKTNLQEVQNRRIQNLSKGFKQRVGIAQALVSSPKILILDEPTVGLDPKQVQDVRKLIHSLRGEHTVILSTHILSEVQASCDEVIIINEGRIVAQESIQYLTNMTEKETHLSLKISRPSEALRESLLEIEGVMSVTSKESHWDLRVLNQDPCIEKVSSHIVQSGSGLVELIRHQNTLEDIFISLTNSKKQ